MSHTKIPGSDERQLPEFNAMQRVKRRFFAMRNGALAAQMKAHGADYRINFGLNLPQIAEIAREFSPAANSAAPLPRASTPTGESQPLDMADFARRLRDNSSTRESMLIAPMLFPIDRLTAEEAEQWARTVPTPEVADVLCLKLLRNHPAAPAIARRLCAIPATSTPADSTGPNNAADSNAPLIQYCGLRLLLNLLQAAAFTPTEATITPSEARAIASVVPTTPLTATLHRQLADEIAFLEE